MPAEKPSSDPTRSADGEGPGVAARVVGSLTDLSLRTGGRVVRRLGLEDAARTVFDRVLAAPLAEQMTRRLIEQGVIERVTAELIAGGVPTRVVDQVMASELPEQVIDRLMTREFTERVVERVLESPGIEPAAVEVIESELVDELTQRVLDSEEMQRTIEHVAESPEVRNALTRQGVGLIEDVGRQLGALARRLDGVVEVPFRLVFRRGRREGPVAQAGVVSRGLALVVDVLVLNAMFFVISAAIALVLSLFGGADQSVSPGAVVVGGAVWFAGAVLYAAVFWTLAGQTLGMRFARLRLAKLDGGGLRLRDSIRRLVGMVLAAIPFFLGYAAILVNERRRGWHDRFAHTEVSYVLDELMPGQPAAAGPPRLQPGQEYHGPGQREPE
jgi:uncharacterized RDD family membrane protein YckC